MIYEYHISGVSEHKNHRQGVNLVVCKLASYLKRLLQHDFLEVAVLLSKQV